MTPHEREIVDRFLDAFNRIEAAMRTVLKSREPFGLLLQAMFDRNRIFNQEYSFLNDCRQLRNILVHRSFKDETYMALPGSAMVGYLEELADKFEDIPTVYTYCAKDVQSVQIHDTMYRVMNLIQETDYTQFPIYDDDKFVSLLTENVLTRWLAKHVVTIHEMPFADLRHTVEQALTLQDTNAHWQFVPRKMTIPEATALFAEKPVLEALIITERGKKKEKPIGIVTRTDALDLLDGKLDPRK